MYGWESWTAKKAEHWRINVLNCGVGEDPLESLGLQGEEISQSKGNQPWIFIGRTGAEAPILWPHNVKNWLIRKDPDTGKDWRQAERGTTEDEMAGWHHWFDGHKLEQAPGDGEGWWSLVSCSPWGHKELDTTKQLKNNQQSEPRYPTNTVGYIYCALIYL